MIFAKNKDFCQEFLRVILEDDKLEVIEKDIQKVIPSAFNNTKSYLLTESSSNSFGIRFRVFSLTQLFI